jgi:Tfp pilus assembly PilM family ATPase
VMRAARLPLGIDMGRAGIRIAELVLDSGQPHLRRVHAHVFDGPPAGERHIGRLIADTLTDAKVTERRCIFAVGEPDATIRTVAFPPMPSRERDRAARFEASRFVDYSQAEAWVRTRPVDRHSGLFVLGVLRRTRLRSLQEVARAARLHLIAVDHESYALRRSLPHADAILDVGHLSTRLYIFGSAAPLGTVIDGGAQEFTHAIARGLDIDSQTAERRKRTVGLAGSASEELAAFTHSVGRAILSARGQGAGEVQCLILAGNGARLPGLVEGLERITGCAVEIAGTVGVERSAYPQDVVRAGAPDWSLSVGLALWTLCQSATA